MRNAFSRFRRGYRLCRKGERRRALPWHKHRDRLLAAVEVEALEHGLRRAGDGRGIDSFLIERQLVKAALWSLVASLFAIGGLMHAYSLTPGAVREELRPGFAWEAAAGYLALAAIFAFFAVSDRRGRGPCPGRRGRARAA